MRQAAHHRQLERRGLEAHVARTVGQHETEVDVEEVTVSVDEDVSVVSVLDLEEVGGHRVAGERLDEVSLGTLVLSGRRIAVGLEMRNQRISSSSKKSTPDERRRN